LILRAVTLVEHKDTQEAAPIEPTFLDYLQSGWQINLGVAIDYTLSNDENYEVSLHSQGPENQYELTINMVGGILEPYDYDKLIPVYGFGGKPTFLDPNAAVSHCFPLSDKPVVGVQGILDVYR
jgi:hypothetical protein